MIMGCAGNYWDARGNVGKDLCSPMDTTCIAQGSAATSQFNNAWSQCAAPTNYLTLAPKSQSPNQAPVDQQYSAMPTAAPVRPLSPHPAITTGSYFWLVGPRQFPFQPMVVNPSPGSQSTDTGTSQASPASVLSQANGGYVTGGYLGKSGLPDWAMLLAGGGLLMAVLGGKR